MTSMIHSLNRQDVSEADYPEVGGGTRGKCLDPSKWPYVCDCCRMHVSAEAVKMKSGYWHWQMNPRLVVVADVTYFGCSTECARILFDIHSRYAQLVSKGECSG